MSLTSYNLTVLMCEYVLAEQIATHTLELIELESTLLVSVNLL